MFMLHLPKVIAIIAIVGFYFYARPLEIGSKERAELAKDFKFETKSVNVPQQDLKPVYVRDVHPQYKNISTWISSVGTSVALFDYDGDGLVNDLVSIDPRFNKVFISPVDKHARFTPFELKEKNIVCDETMIATGILTNDFNDDGRTDVLVFYFGRSPIVFYQTPDKGFVDTELVQNECYNTATGTLADFNGDGHTDIILGNYFPDKSKLYAPKAKDNDQIMQHSFSRGDNGARNRIFLWTGLKNGVAAFKEYKDWDKDLPLPYDWTLAVAAADINNDLLPDLYIANDFGPDKLLLNTSKNGRLSFREIQGKKGFTTTRSNVIGHDSFKGMGAEFADINNDGLLDIYVSNIAEDFALNESHFMFVNTGDSSLLKAGIAPFENKSEELGLSRSSWGWDSRLADFNNDGIPEAVQATGFVKGKINRWPELQELATANDELLSSVKSWPRLVPGDEVSGNSHIPFFVRHKSGKYFDVSNEIGIDEIQITRGIAVGDIEHDGKLDFISSGQWEDSKVYHNKSSNTRPFLGIALKFPLGDHHSKSILIDSNITSPSKFAIGAVARIKFKNGKKLIRFVDGGNGHSGRNSQEMHFSFESEEIQDAYEVELEWRKSDGTISKSCIRLKSGWHTVFLPY